MASDLGLKMRLKAVDKMSSAIDKVKGKIPKLTATVDKANRKFNRMKGLTASVSKRFDKMGSKMKRVGAGMSIGLTAPIVAFGASTIRAAVAFDTSMNKVEALTKATGKDLLRMRNLAKDLGATTQFSASQAADAMGFLGMAGWTTAEILENKTMRSILDLATATGTDLARTADIASNVMGAFKISAADAGLAADVLAAATSSANVDMEMLAESMKNAAPVAKMYGLSFQETTAAVGLLGNVGIQASMSGNTLKRMMLNLTAPTSRAKTIIKSLGIDVLKSDGSMRSLTGILSDLGPAMSKIPKAKQLALMSELFGKVAIAGAGELLDQAVTIGKDGKNGIERFTDAMKDAIGTTKRMAKTMQKGAPGAVKALASSFEGLQIAIAESGVLEIFTDIITGITGIFRSLAKSNPKLLKFGAIAAVVVAAVGPLLVAMGFMMTALPGLITLWGVLSAGFSIVAGVVPVVWAALTSLIPVLAAVGAGVWTALAPLLPFIAAAAAIAGVAYLIYKNWEPIKAFFSDIFTNPLGELQDMVSYAADLAKTAGSFLGFGDNEDETDKKLRAQGFSVTNKLSGEKGAPLGAKAVNQKSQDSKNREKKSQLDVVFSNMPKGTNIISADNGNLLGDIRQGMMGASI